MTKRLPSKIACQLLWGVEKKNGVFFRFPLKSIYFPGIRGFVLIRVRTRPPTIALWGKSGRVWVVLSLLRLNLGLHMLGKPTSTLVCAALEIFLIPAYW